MLELAGLLLAVGSAEQTAMPSSAKVQTRLHGANETLTKALLLGPFNLPSSACQASLLAAIRDVTEAAQLLKMPSLKKGSHVKERVAAARESSAQCLADFATTDSDVRRLSTLVSLDVHVYQSLFS